MISAPRDVSQSHLTLRAKGTGVGFILFLCFCFVCRTALSLLCRVLRVLSV